MEFAGAELAALGAGLFGRLGLGLALEEVGECAFDDGFGNGEGVVFHVGEGQLWIGAKFTAGPHGCGFSPLSGQIVDLSEKLG